MSASKGSGIAEKTRASTISASRTIPSTRFTSTNFAVREPWRRLLAKIRKTQMPRNIASNEAMEKIQLSNADRTKIPSERQITQALQATRFGEALVSVE